MEGAVSRVAEALREKQKGYICMAGVHGIMEAQRDPSLLPIYAQSLMTAPDGTPTTWVGRWQGHSRMERVPGPELMIEIIGRKEFAQYTHYFYGGKEGVAEELREALTTRFPRARIVGTFTPPFRDLTSTEELEFIEDVRKRKPDIIWVGISTPKQEHFMARYLARLDTTLMFGVGAAFDFHTGRIQDCANWIKRAGLQWLDRLVQDPRHLWKRYLRNNPSFVCHILLQLTGLRIYPTVKQRARQYSVPLSRVARGNILKSSFSETSEAPHAITSRPRIPSFPVDSLITNIPNRKEQ
jgi:N-acetylglucosaminyldiphosphoundecaprenol N-acetyl-beta-D-mannosaminyltransferase